MNLDKILKFYHYTVDNSYMFSGHTHDSWEANIVLKGNLEVTVNANVLKLSAGDMAVWSPMMFHCNRVISTGETEFLSVRFLAFDNSLSKDNISFYCLDQKNMSLIDVLVNDIDSTDGVINEEIEALFNALLLRIKRNEQQPKIDDDGVALVYRNAVDYMTNNLDKYLSITEIAKHCCVCETTLKQVFKQYAGKSIKKFYRDYKVQKAIEMLNNGVSAKEVSCILGYSSLSYFSQCFKKETGCNIRQMKQKKA